MNITVGQVFRCAAAAVLLSALTSLAAPAQRFNISTNLMEYANLGTLNLDVLYGVARNWSVGAGVRCNPFKFESERRVCRLFLHDIPAFQHRVRTRHMGRGRQLPELLVPCLRNHRRGGEQDVYTSGRCDDSSCLCVLKNISR